MFKNLQQTIRLLNADINNVANCEKAKKLRKKLLSIGLPIAIVGFLGVIVCFILFATAGFDAFDSNGFTPRVIVPFVLLIPCALMGGIGSTIAKLGFSIVITGYTSKVINETIGNNCPSCGNTINSEMLFCPKCGTKLKKQCPNCNNLSDNKNEYCEKCGTKLN